MKIKCKLEMFSNLWFDSKKEVNSFHNYIENKGLFLHKHVYDTLILYREQVQYSELAQYIIYDKGIRNVLYRNLGAIEEYYRSMIINDYDIDFEIDDLRRTDVRSNDLSRSNGVTSNLYRFTFSSKFTLKKLIDFLKALKIVDDLEYKDLDDLREFRNKVMHHNFVIISYYKTTKEIEMNINEVERLCELIYNYLPVVMKSAFQGNINKCNHITSKSSIPNLEILCLREMKNGLFR